MAVESEEFGIGGWGRQGPGWGSLRRVSPIGWTDRLLCRGPWCGHQLPVTSLRFAIQWRMLGVDPTGQVLRFMPIASGREFIPKSEGPSGQVALWPHISLRTPQEGGR